MSDQTIQARLADQLEREPGKRAITFIDEQGSFIWYSLEQFTGLAAKVAARLKEHGLSQGSVCLIVLPSGEFSASLVLATLWLGGVPLLIAPPALQRGQALSSLEQVLFRIVRKTRPRVVILPESMSARREDLARVHRNVRLIFNKEELSPAVSSNVPLVVPDENAVAAMQLTSGTTGFPRVCVWRQLNVVAALDGMSLAMGLTDDDVCLNWTPLYHDMGLVNNFFLCMTRGLPLAMLSPTDFVGNPALWLRGLHATGATTTWSPNFGFALATQRVTDAEIEGVQLEGVRAFWNAAEKIHYETMIAFHERFASHGVRSEALKTNYGCAENVGGATFSALDDSFVVEYVDRNLLYQKRIARALSAPLDDDRAVAVASAGKAYPGMRIQILSPHGKPLPDGHVGEVALDTPSRMIGYLGDATETRRALANGLLRTGDLGYLRNGELFWVGRVRERITVRGKKIDPSDFERVLLQISDLRSGCFAAFGVDDPDQGTQDIVIVAEVRNDSPATPETLIGKVRQQVFMRMGLNVREVVLVRPGTLSKTSSGKRRHRFFQRMYLEGKLKDLEWDPGVPRSLAAS